MGDRRPDNADGRMRLPRPGPINAWVLHLARGSEPATVRLMPDPAVLDREDNPISRLLLRD